jgi:chemotaxis protein CheY-P-specific phosphatase CheC
MNVDTDSLERLNLLTRDAAERASNALADAVGASTHIGATKIMLASRGDIVADLLGASEECLQFELDGPLSGTVLVAIDPIALERIHDAIDDPGDTTAIVAAMMDEFVTDWERHLGDELAVGERTRITDPRDHDFAFEAVSDDSDSSPVFQSTVHWLQAPGSVTLYLAPDRDALERLLAIDETDVAADETADEAGGEMPEPDESADGPFASADDGADDPFGGTAADDGAGDDPFATADGGDGSAFASADDGGDDAAGAFGMGSSDDGDSSGFGTESGGSSLFDDDDAVETVPLDKLSVFSDLTREGTTAAADRVSQMTGIETETEIAGVSFTPIDDISGELEEGEYVGTTVEFEGTPSGHLVILFREASAANIAEAMMPMEPEGEGLTAMHESAIEELCNIMTSGFIDGWANVLQTAVEHTPPEYVDNMDMALMEIVTEQLGPFQTHAYTIESRMKTDEIEFDCEIHALPNEAELGQALESLMLERKDETQADPSDLF